MSIASLHPSFYTAKGPQDLAGGKTVIVTSTRGGVYSTTDGVRAGRLIPRGSREFRPARRGRSRLRSPGRAGG